MLVKPVDILPMNIWMLQLVSWDIWKGTMNLGLTSTRCPTILEDYCDTNWLSNNDKTHSTSGYVFTLGEVAILCKSSKQTYDAWSTMEFEFVTLEKAIIKFEISTCWNTNIIILSYFDFQAINMCGKI